MDSKEIFSKRLVQLREDRGITQQTLADDLEITRQSLSLYEKAERTINIDLLVKIARYFDVSADYLIGLSNNQNNKKNMDDITIGEAAQNTEILTGLNQNTISKLINLNIDSANPAERARLPKIEKHEADFLEPEELAEVLTAADQEQPNIRLFVYLLAASGGRRGEVVGLRWRDINFEFGQIHFEQTVLYRKNLGIYTDTPKNEKSDRFLRLPPEMMKMLSDYKQEWEQVKKKCGTAYPKKIKLPNGSGQLQDIEPDFVFTQTKRFGFPISPDTTNGWLNKLSEKYGLKPLHPHMFRHSAASTLIYAGVDVVSVAGYLGHATPTTTQNIYSHILQEAQNRNAAIIGSAMFQKKKPLSDNENGSGEKAI